MTTATDGYTRHVNPGRSALLARYYGRAPEIARRDGVRFQDADGRWYLNCHCNGGIFNLGHRPRETVRALKDALNTLDVGNAWLPSEPKGQLGERLAATTDGLLDGVFFATSGGEAIDIAIKVARGSTRRPKVVCVEGGYHGHTGLATATGTDAFQNPWHYRLPDFQRIAWNDLDALEAAVDDTTALVLLETIPATLGMPLPTPGWHAGARALTRDRGALLCLDEVQTGLGRTGRRWGYEHDAVDPDMIVIGKGLGGGVYPMSATLVRADLLGVLNEHPFAQFASFAGSDLGCTVSLAVLDVLERPGFLEGVQALAARFASGLVGLPIEVRQRGLMIGLATGTQDGGVRLAQALLAHGVWTVPAGNDPSVCQLLPPLVLTDADADEVIVAIAAACADLLETEQEAHREHH